MPVAFNNESNGTPGVEAKVLMKMYKRGASAESIFQLIHVPRTLKVSAGDTGVQFRRAVLREFVALLKRHRAKAELNGRGGRGKRKHVKRGSR
jgi:hypothetical protein